MASLASIYQVCVLSSERREYDEVSSQAKPSQARTTRREKPIATLAKPKSPGAKSTPKRRKVGSSTAEEDFVGTTADDVEQTEQDRSTTLQLKDPDVLDCPICFNPFTIPLYQCDQGHVICSACCSKTGRKCATCSSPIGQNRCIAFEKLLQSIQISCLYSKYGCTDTFSTLGEGNYQNHKVRCTYVPCYCPYTGCDFVASSKDLYLHFGDKHDACGVEFLFDHYFSVVSKIDHGDPVILNERIYGNLFLLYNTVESMGNAIRICCIGPKSRPGYDYDVSASTHGCTLTFTSVTENIQQCSSALATTSSSKFLLIPKVFFGSCEPLVLNIRIRYSLDVVPKYVPCNLARSKDVDFFAKMKQSLLNEEARGELEGVSPGGAVVQTLRFLGKATGLLTYALDAGVGSAEVEERHREVAELKDEVGRSADEIKRLKAQLAVSEERARVSEASAVREAEEKAALAARADVMLAEKTSLLAEKSALAEERAKVVEEMKREYDALLKLSEELVTATFETAMGQVKYVAPDVDFSVVSVEKYYDAEVGQIRDIDEAPDSP